MDITPHHVEVEKQPSSSWRKAEIVDWLDKHDITYDKNMLKAQKRLKRVTTKTRT